MAFSKLRTMYKKLFSMINPDEIDSFGGKKIMIKKAN